MFDEITNTLRINMGRFYLFICLCGNEKKFEDEKARREIQDENDILKEEFDRRKSNTSTIYHIELDTLRKLWSSNPE